MEICKNANAYMLLKKWCPEEDFYMFAEKTLDDDRCNFDR